MPRPPRFAVCVRAAEAGRRGYRRLRRDRVVSTGHEARLKRAWLHTHVRKQVHGRLLHRRIRCRSAAIVMTVQTPRPLDRSGAEYQGATGVLIQRQGVCRGPRAVGGPVVLELLADAQRRRRERDEPCRTEVVVEVLIPLGAERTGGQRRAATDWQRGDPRVSPERLRRKGLRNCNCGVRRTAVDGEDGSRQRVFWSSAVGGWAEPRIAPCSGPRRGIGRVDHRVGVGLLVADERAVRRETAIDARFPSRLPEHFVPAEEREIYTGVARALDVGSLRAGPVRIMPDR